MTAFHSVCETTNEELARFIQASPSPFHATAELARRLDDAGFSFLPEQMGWDIRPGEGYYTTRNGSSIIAFKVPAGISCPTFRIAAAHTDSPTFKVKHVPALAGEGGYLRLNVEAYGGMIDASWLDRPLTLAGRAMVRTPEGIRASLIHFDRDLLIIPSLAIHMNPQANKGLQLNRQVDLCPLASAGEMSAEDIPVLIAEELGAAPEDVLSSELFLANRQRPLTWGARSEFFSAPKLDNLQGSFACLQAFLAADTPGHISVFASFDNEEVGSNTKQGAMSTFLHDTLLRCCLALGGDQEGFLRAQASSLLASCDNAHALHPNHPEKADACNRPLLNRGIVVKEAANQKYTTDAFSRAAFEAACKKDKVPFQTFANRSDSQGGSTLGNLSNIQFSVHAVDVGMPQLAMHSAFETTGAADTALGIQALRSFFEADLSIEGASLIRIR